MNQDSIKRLKQLFVPLLKNKINKFIKDEITASVAYVKWANQTVNANIRKHLREHAKDEFKHYTQLVEFLYTHDIAQQMDISIDHDIANMSFDNDRDIVLKVQELEREAIRDYTVMSKLGMIIKNPEILEFFTDLMEEEQEHFDDLAQYVGQSRRTSL